MEVVLIFPYGDDVEEIHFLGRYYTATEFDLVGHCIYIINMGFFYVLKLFFPQIFVISMADVIEGRLKEFVTVHMLLYVDRKSVV